MSNFAALVARTDGSWRGAEVDLGEVEDIEDVVELMRDAGNDADSVVMFVEENDEWFAVVRIDKTGEPRVFISDARMVALSELAGVLFADLVTDEVADEGEAIAEDEDIEADDDRPIGKAAAEPGGATDILADFGISGAELLAMCAEEGQLPADVVSSICERLGCGDAIEVYR